MASSLTFSSSISWASEYDFAVIVSIFSGALDFVDRVKLSALLPNCPEYLYCWFGLAKLGAVAVTINTQFRGESLKYLIEASDSQLVVIAPDFLAQYDEATSEIKGVKKVGRSTVRAEEG